MKKLMTLMLGMTLMFGTVSAVFGQQGDTTKKETKKKKGGKKKTDAPKKDGGSTN
jgi:hypothetical protein